MESAPTQYLIFLISIGFFVIIIVLVLLTNYVQKKRTQFIIEKERAKAAYEEQLLKTQLEINEQIMKNIGQELHDNIGQILSVASMEMKMAMMKEEVSISDLSEASSLVSESIDQLRQLSKTLNTEAIMEFGLEKSIDTEFSRLERLGIVKTKLQIDTPLNLYGNKAMLLFRIFQEFVANSIKHAEAKNLMVIITTKEESLSMILKDDGKGFDINNVSKNNGLINMQSRTNLMNGELQWISSPDNGTALHLTIPLNQAT